MHFLLRIIPVLFLVWLIWKFFDSLGRKNALNENKKKQDSNNRRKPVESKVVDKEDS